MWIWILIIFIVGGAIIGAMSDDNKGDGMLAGALMGLIEGSGCLIRLFLLFLGVMLAVWLFS